MLERLLGALANGNDQVVENALGILAQWMEVPGHEPTAGLAAIGLILARRSVEAPSDFSPMMSLVRVLVLRRVGIGAADLCDLVVRTLQRGSEPDENDLQLFDLAILAGGDAFVETIVNALIDASESADPRTWFYAVDDAHLLSHLSARGYAEKVLAVIGARAPRHVRRLMDHIAVASGAGGLDPMFEAMLTEYGGDENVRNAAADVFMSDRTAFIGPYSLHLEERLNEAARLSRDHANDRVRTWAAWLSGRLAERLDDARRRDEEAKDE